jgi:hypothetical protein
MPHHEWGEKDFDWNGLDEAVTYISGFCKKWGRLGGQAKEKWGCVRFYARFGTYSLLSLTHPNYCHYGPYPKWLMTLDIWYGSKILKYTGIRWIFSKIQPIVYNRAYQNALKKWPHLRAEILCDADYLELIKGVTRKEGNDLHVLGWNGEILTTWSSN